MILLQYFILSETNAELTSNFLSITFPCTVDLVLTYIGQINLKTETPVLQYTCCAVHLSSLCFRFRIINQLLIISQFTLQSCSISPAAGWSSTEYCRERERKRESVSSRWKSAEINNRLLTTHTHRITPPCDRNSPVQGSYSHLWPLIINYWLLILTDSLFKVVFSGKHLFDRTKVSSNHLLPLKVVHHHLTTGVFDLLYFMSTVITSSLQCPFGPGL